MINKLNIDMIGFGVDHHLKCLIDSLVSKKEPTTGQNDFISSMVISLTIDKSVKSNMWEKIKYLNNEN
jgi:hypothetical protein